MSTYTAQLRWQRQQHEAFSDNRYSRRHDWAFDGGAVVPGSSSPHSVPLPYSDAGAVDPEEALVAATSSCHLLWFLFLAAKAGFVVDAYDDAAEGLMARNAQGRMAITRITLRPAVRFGGTRQPTATEFEALHHQAHDECYIANSLRADVVCVPSLVEA